MKVREIPLEKIFITKNVRFDTDEDLGELIESTEHLLLQPIGVYPRLGDKRGDYELVWGNRRYNAAKANNEPTIAAHILEQISESDIPIIKLQENMVRKQLTSEEIVAAADEIKRRRPELGDHQIDRLLGKRAGYLSYHRSTIRTFQWLAAQGLKQEHLRAMTSEELGDLKAKLEAREDKKPRRGTFHRGDRTPKFGFEIVSPRGPNIVLICASPLEKKHVLSRLKKLTGKSVFEKA
jgi:ParB-like chromosome segregation protein Spo0J